MSMNVDVQRGDDGVFTVVCPAELGWQSRVDLVEALQIALQNEEVSTLLPGVIVDLGAVDHINSAGIGGIFALRKYAVEHGGGLVVSRPRPLVSRVLAVVNLPALIPVTGDLETARRVLNRIVHTELTPTE